jgi:DNA mismatch repair protein MutS2
MEESNSLTVLEFDKIRTILTDTSYTPAGKELSRALAPMDDDDALNRKLDETTEMAEILKYEEPFPLQRLDDSERLLHIVSTEGAYLNPEDLLKFRIFLEICGRLKKYVKNKAEKYRLIASYLNEIKVTQNIIDAIEQAIDKTGEVRDSASPELRKIRIERSSARNKILRKLESMIKSRRPVGSRQDDLITIRDGRYVIPVAEGDLSAVAGVVHDRSKSGATIYVEPMQTVDLNNRLRRLDSKEEQEIERILLSIADLIRAELEALNNNYHMIAIVDSIHARGLLSVRLDAERPVIITDNRVKLISTRHPLLLKQAQKRDDVVPMTVSLGGKFDALVVTGPNTGGKTVALKSLGLSVLMARSGLHIPADKESEVGSIHKIFADIGDEQSIELSLSTFSSHLSRIIHTVKNCDKHSLILLDEIGAGTDPKEGSALAEAILAHVVKRGGLAFVTTHYSALKTLPEKYPRIENASLEFDHATLQPTYCFRMGLPGSSYAIEIARRLGMPQKIVQKAEKLVGTHERSLANLLEKLETELEQSRKERVALADQESVLNKRTRKLTEKEAKLKERREDFERKEMEEAHEMVQETRRELENLVKRIREKQAHKTVVRNAHAKLNEIENGIDKHRRKLSPQKIRKEEKLSTGETVWVETLQAEGELLECIESSKAWKVRVGNMISTVKTEFLSKVAENDTRPQLPSGINYAPFEDVPTQISVRGMTSEEATEAVDRFLDRASLSNLDTVYILHGKGTGALRQAVKKYLSKHPLVSDFRLGYVSEGSSGVTVVTIKRS